MNKKYYTLLLIICLVATGMPKTFSQSLTRVGNANFPINDNTSIAPVSAINSGWQINGIGKIITIVPHPSISTTLYATTGSGGIFKTTNSGTSWLPVSGSFLPGVQFGALAIDPGNTNIMYAGSGEPSYAQIYGWGGYGTFKSTDAGTSWTQINVGMGNVVVLDILINPINTLELIAATNNGIFKSTNAGASWTVVMSAASSWIQQVRLVSGNTLVAVGGTRFYRSVDFGNTWATSDLDPAFSSSFANGRVAVAPSNSNIIYAGWVNNTFSSASNVSLYYSTDGGISFTKKYAFTDAVKLISYDGVSTTGYGWANFILTVSLTDPNTIYSGGHLIFKSTNNGVNWTQKTANWYCCIHTDIRQLIFDPANTSRILAATDGGVFASTSDAVNWVQLSDGLACNQYLSMGQSNIDPNFVIGGLQDNGVIYNNTDGNYHTYTGGDLYDHMTCDYTNSYNVYTSNSNGKVFNPYNRSQKANLNLPANILSSGTANSRQSFFISPLDPAVAFGWGTNVWRSSNINSYDLAAGTSSVAWTQISTFGVTIRDVKISPATNDILYALGNNATVYKSENATEASPAFTAIALPGGASTSIEGSLAVSTLNPNVLYATANNAVYRSSNAGASWTNYTATGLPAINFEKIFVDPYSSIESVYLVTTLGIYYRDLSMSSWTAVNPQVPAQQQNSIASYAGLINGASLFKGSGSSSSHVSFATWGSGIWKAGFYNQLNNALPTGWSNTDIGSPTPSGSGFYDNTKLSFNVKGGGSGLNSSATDQFNFTKATVSGNSDIIAQVYSVAETDPENGLSKTGIMLRSSINANSAYVMVALTGHAGAVFQYRVNAGDIATVSTTVPAPTIAYPYWLKLNKNSSNVITAFISPDGNTWTQVGQVTVALGASFLAGIVNSSYNAVQVNNAAVGNVSLQSFVIPIQNIALQATLKDKNKVALSWSFDSNERDNTGAIEKSTDGTNFVSIFRKTYTNSSSAEQTFRDALVDEAPFKGINYYRLKTTGQDGQVKYSNTALIRIDQDFTVKIEPNPVKNNSELKIVISGGPASKVIFNIYDLAGRIIQSETFSNEGINSIQLKPVSTGTYLYKLIYENKSIPGKLLVN